MKYSKLTFHPVGLLRWLVLLLLNKSGWGTLAESTQGAGLSAEWECRAFSLVVQQLTGEDWKRCESDTMGLEALIQKPMQHTFRFIFVARPTR
jgi:hypothetical protein